MQLFSFTAKKRKNRTEYVLFRAVKLRKMGLEPTRHCCHKILSLARLPVPTLPPVLCTVVIVPPHTPKVNSFFQFLRLFSERKPVRRRTGCPHSPKVYSARYIFSPSSAFWSVSSRDCPPFRYPSMTSVSTSRIFSSSPALFSSPAHTAVSLSAVS